LEVPPPQPIRIEFEIEEKTKREIPAEIPAALLLIADLIWSL